MEDSNHSSLMSHFQSKKTLLTTKTTPIKTTTTLSVPTPEKSNPNSNTRFRNNNFALSISDVRREALRLSKSNTVGSDHPGIVPEKLSGFGSGSTSSLPQKYEMLCDFFVAMVNSFRLLRMKRVPATFTKLACHIESLTDRRFTLHHLAQMKYIVQEVIVVKKIRVLDEKTKCMQEDYLLSIEMDAAETDKDTKVSGGYSQLKKMFRSRVIDFSKTHIEDDDIPEGELPHLFHQLKHEPELNSSKTSTPLVAPLVAPSFKRRFSSKALGGQVSDCTSGSTCLSETLIKEATSSEVNDESFSITDEALLGPILTPAKLASIPQKFTSTPSELASTPARLMATMPALRTPKRALMTQDDDTCELTNKSTKRRSLKFDESSTKIEDQLPRVDEEDNILPAQGSIIAKDDVLAVLPENLLHSVSHKLIDKEEKIKEEKDPFVSQARRRQQMMAGVPKLLDMIRLLFQSIRRTVITKEELIHKLLSGHLDITDRIEVEEQLKLLQELAPEYITDQISLGGDTLVRLNKSTSADSIRSKLLEASSS